MRVRWHCKKLLKSLVLLLVLSVMMVFYKGQDTGSIGGSVLEETMSVFGMGSLQNASMKRSGMEGAHSVQVGKKATHTSFPDIKPSNGEGLAKSLQQKCQGRPRVKKFIQAVTSSRDYNIMFCPMCKLASTFWTRFFKMLGSYNDARIETPYDIPISDAPPTKERLTYNDGSFSPVIYQKQYKFLFVRNPYSRILSAYVDKLFAPNPTFWKGVCTAIIRAQRYPPPSKGKPLKPVILKNCGSDLKFEEYVRAIVTRHNAKPLGSVDCHDSEFHSSCHACSIPYNFVGKMESFMDDSVFLFKKLGLNKTLNAIQKFPGLLDNDALYDTVTSAFNFKKDVIKCISWHEALKRVWKKLQIRGVIGKEQFPLNATESGKIELEEFIWLVKETKLKTSSAERRKQRREAFIEIYRSVPLDLLNKLKDVYSADFELFSYERSPDSIFDRTREYIPYGYLNI